LNSEKNTWYCDPCGEGGGVVDFADAHGVDLDVLRGNDHRRPVEQSRLQRARKPSVHFEPSGPITEATRDHFASRLGKDYRLETWRRLGVQEGRVDDQPAIGFPLPTGGWKVCLYRLPDPKRGKPYSWRVADGGKACLLVVGEGDKVLVVAGEWDLLAAVNAGVACVATGTAGEGTWRPDWSEQLRGLRVRIVYDVDAEGRRGAAKVAAALRGIASEVCVVLLPLSGRAEEDGKDLSDFLLVHGLDRFHEVLSATAPEPEGITNRLGPLANGGASSEDRLRQIEEILRFVPENADPLLRNQSFERVVPLLTGLDPAAQDLGIQCVKQRLRISKRAVRTEIERHQQHEPTRQDEEPEPPVSADSFALLDDHDLVQRFLEDTTTLGVVGEDENKVMLLLVMSSRRGDHPLNAVVKGESSGGKNHLVGAVARCFPPAEVVFTTSLSPQSLGYWQGDLKHKVLIVAEAAGSERADYSLRVLQSEGSLSFHYVAKVDGQLQTVEKKVEGPAATITTTTRESLHPENETRIIELTLDETVEQTGRIHRRQAADRVAGIDPTRIATIEELWRGAQRALESLPVIVPFAKLIRFPTNRVRARRDFPKLLNLVEASAFIHQRQRERREVAGRMHLVADVRDYALAYDLMNAFLQRVQAGVNSREIRVLELLQRAASEHMTARTAGERLGWDGDAGRKRAKRYLESLRAKGYAAATDSEAGVATEYWLRDEAPTTEPGISTPEELGLAWREQGGQVPTTWTSPLSGSKAQI